jgi:phage FluMu gp28-like protein
LTRLFNVARKTSRQIVIDSDRDIKTFVIEFANGTKIHALSSNPKALRSKGGKVVLDEFAHHDEPEKMWSAARPVITWGFPLRILSTHNGKSCKFYKFVDAAKKGRLRWSYYTVDIYRAVEEGLVVIKILKKSYKKGKGRMAQGTA